VFAENDDDIKPCFLTPRYALQMLGTEWGRHCYPDTWAVMCVRTAQRLLKSKFENSKTPGYHPLYYTAQEGIWQGQNVRQVNLITVSDVRFRNEMRIIREAGGKLVRVRRPGAGLKGSTGLHPSEAEQAGIPDAEFDIVIENNGTLEQFQKQASVVAHQVGHHGP